MDSPHCDWSSTIRSSRKSFFDLRSDLYSHIQLLPLRWFDNRATGDLMTRVLEDVTSVERVLIDGIDQGTVAVLQILIALAGMFYLNPKLTLVGLAPVPFLAGVLCGTRSRHIGGIDCNAAPLLT
jgi:ABC-type multidrug transport system fused ATPase/permease subunit